jgi:hypothetical protein
MSEEQEQAQTHPPSWASMFDHSDPPLFEDAGPSYFPDERSSAARHAGRVRDRERAAAQRRDLAVIQAAADDQADEHALEQAASLTSRGLPVAEALRIRAARAARRAGNTPSTAEQHAARALGRRRPEGDAA